MGRDPVRDAERGGRHPRRARHHRSHLTASLIVLVIFSGYANFVSRIDLDEHPGWPAWMADIDFSELKLKLLASIVAIAAIKLLEAYMNIDHETDRELYWQAGLYGVFVVSALLLGISEWFGRGEPHK